MTIDPAPGSAGPVLHLNDVDGVTIRQSQVASVHVTGSKSKEVRLIGTESNVTKGPGVPPESIKYAKPQFE